MKLKVVKNAYYVSEDLTGMGFVNENQLKSSFSHILVVGDIWEKKVEGEWEFFECIEGEWKGEESDGWWEYDDFTKHYFEEI